MKSKVSLWILAMVLAALLPLAALCQIAPERPKHEQVEPPMRWEISAGYAYTSLNQVDQSRYGLQGVNVAVNRDFGRYFGVTAEGTYYSMALAQGNPGTPTVVYVLMGPVAHAELSQKTEIFVHALLGVAHTGGESIKPDISFAGGPGGGLDYRMSKKFWLRASGDVIASSFVSDPNNLGYSTHERWNSRAMLGVVFKF